MENDPAKAGAARSSAWQRIRTNFGTAALVALNFGAFGLAAIYFSGVFSELQESRYSDNSTEMREVIFALSEVDQVDLIIHDAPLGDVDDEELRGTLKAAADQLFLRQEKFAARLDANPSEAGNDARVGMRRIVELTDAFAAGRISDFDDYSALVFHHSEEVHAHLRAYADEILGRQDALIAVQRARSERQTDLLIGFFTIAALVLLWAIYLLRREMTMRRMLESAQARARYLAYHDDLTEVPNRAKFHRLVTNLLEAGEEGTLFLSDLDEFKTVNDTHGHATGDALLRLCAQRMSAAVAKYDGSVARLSGDEFAIWLPNTRLPQAVVIAEHVLSECRRPTVIEENAITPSISIGIASTASAGAARELDTLFRTADFALYSAKKAGRGRVVVFDKALEARFHEHRAMIVELPAAIENEDILLYLQPKVSLETREVFGFEALARWQRAGRIIPPDEFVTLAESSGSIIALDLIMLKKAVGALATWNAVHDTRLGVSVNLSALHFRSRSIVESIEKSLATAGLPPELLTIEITESVQMRQGADVERILSDIRDLGCLISIDDFGTGYSSLAHLRALHADELKIDRSLIAEIEHSDRARFVLDAVLELSHALGMTVIVEGIETVSQERALKALGCQWAQGFLFGAPAPAEVALRRTVARPSQRQTG